MLENLGKILSDKKVAILGFAREGKSTYQQIRKILPNKELLIIDKNDVRNDEILKGDNNLIFKRDDNLQQLIDEYDYIFKTPGISLVGLSNVSSDKILTQTEIVLKLFKDRIIGVTGTKGKSTTSSLICHVLNNCGIKAILAGNIGLPIFDILDDIDDDTFLVLELSAHQLQYVNCSPKISVCLNLFEEHLDFSGGLNNYFMMKMNIFKYQDENDYIVYCADNDNLRNLIDNGNYKAKKTSVSLDESIKSDIYIKNNYICSSGKQLFLKDFKRNILGNHNLENIMVVLGVVKSFNLELSDVLKAIETFKPLSYRIELVKEVKGVSYYVDTLATIPQATIASIEALGGVDTLIFGGIDRGISYEDFVDYLNNSNIKNFVCMPETGYYVADKLKDKIVYKTESMEEAVKIASEITNNICLLSPAAASYNYYKNYIEKGNKFKECVNKL